MTKPASKGKLRVCPVCSAKALDRDGFCQCGLEDYGRKQNDLMPVDLWVETAGLRGDTKLYWASKILKDMKSAGNKPVFIRAGDLDA